MALTILILFFCCYEMRAWKMCNQFVAIWVQVRFVATLSSISCSEALDSVDVFGNLRKSRKT
jgi:hypothetical protein